MMRHRAWAGGSPKPKGWFLRVSPELGRPPEWGGPPGVKDIEKTMVLPGDKRSLTGPGKKGPGGRLKGR